MSYIPLAFPPGMVRPGTKNDARGRWYDGSLVRWHENAMRPVGGWQSLTVSAGTQVDLVGRACGMVAWRANNQTPQLSIGTPTKLYHYSAGVVTDITPVGFTTGLTDASLTSATYGSGLYGAGVYGTGDPSQSALTEAQSWQMDTFGEDLVAVAYSDGKLYYWDKSAGGAAAALTNAPVGNLGVVVTPERFIVALGSASDARKLAWSDQDTDITDWTAGTADQAGDFTLSSVGQLMAGRRGRNETLLWTDQELYAMRYIGGTLVYSFQQLGAACGAISRRSMAVVDGKALWMGYRSFFGYDGFVQGVPCDVGDYVFSDLNRVQASKIHAEVRAEYNEVTWYYPSSSAVECDRYVTYNFAGKFWMIGELERTSGVDRGAFSYPISADSNGKLYQQETGTTYLDIDGTTSLAPYAESGPLSLGERRVMNVLRVVPDEATLGGVRVSLIVSMDPTGTETTYGPYTPAEPTDVRVSGRFVRLRVDQLTADWRLGTMELQVEPAGLR